MGFFWRMASVIHSNSPIAFVFAFVLEVSSSTDHSDASNSYSMNNIHFIFFSSFFRREHWRVCRTMKILALQDYKSCLTWISHRILKISENQWKSFSMFATMSAPGPGRRPPFVLFSNCELCRCSIYCLDLNQNLRCSEMEWICVIHNVDAHT